LGGRGGAPMQIDIGMGGTGRGGTAAGKPRVSPKQARELGIIKQEPQVWSKSLPSGERIPVATPRAAKGKEKISPQPQTPQEKMIAQAQADAAAGKPTLAVTDPRMSRILDKMFPEKGSMQRPRAQPGPRVDIRPDAGQKGPKVTPGKEPTGSAGPSSRREIPGETKWAKRRAAAGSVGLHAIAAGLLAGALSKDKEAGGTTAAAAAAPADQGVTWVDTTDFVPGTIIQEPVPSPTDTAPVQDPDIALEPREPSQIPAQTTPEKPPAPELRVIPKGKNEQPPTTVPTPVEKPGTGTDVLPGTDGDKSVEKPGVSSTDGTGEKTSGSNYKYKPGYLGREPLIFKEQALAEKYQHFLNEETAKEKFLQRVIGPESGGRPEIKNPLSPATGLFQFMPRTWAGVVAKAKPGDAHYGVSFKDMPQNVAAQRAAAKQIADEYAQTIKRTGMPDIPTSYYLLHGHGPKAVEIYKNPDKQLKDIYPEYVRNKKGEMVKSIVYQQNPNFNPNQRLGDFVAKRAKQMGDRLTDVFPTATAGELPREAPVQSTKKSKATKSAEKADTVIKQEPAEQKPIGTIVQPDYSKYKVGDLGPLEKIGPGQWRSTSTGKTVTDAPELENLPAVPRPETFLDKVKRTLPPSLGGGGELVSQVFGDKKKPAAAPDATDKQPAKDPAYEPGTAEYDARMEKLQIAAGDKFSREREARLKATAEKPADKKIELQRDQAGLVKAKRELSDFERAFAAARAEQGTGGTFTWTDPRTGKTDTYGTLYKGEKPPKTVSAVPVDQALSKGEELVDIPVAQAKDRFQPPAPAPTAPAKSEIQQALKDFDRTQERKQERKQDIERVIQQLADVPAATPAPRTAEELASDELWKDIRASAAGKSSDEISAAAQRAKQELDTAIAADSTISKPQQEPTELPGIELKGSTEPYVAPIDVPTDSEVQARRQTAKDAAQDEMKESINTTSHADLHDILRLAGRLK
jgi:hypothetical protein